MSSRIDRFWLSCFLKHWEEQLAAGDAAFIKPCAYKTVFICIRVRWKVNLVIPVWYGICYMDECFVLNADYREDKTVQTQGVEDLSGVRLGCRGRVVWNALGQKSYLLRFYRCNVCDYLSSFFGNAYLMIWYKYLVGIGGLICLHYNCVIRCFE